MRDCITHRRRDGGGREARERWPRHHPRETHIRVTRTSPSHSARRRLAWQARTVAGGHAATGVLGHRLLWVARGTAPLKTLTVSHEVKHIPVLWIFCVQIFTQENENTPHAATSSDSCSGSVPYCQKLTATHHHPQANGKSRRVHPVGRRSTINGAGAQASRVRLPKVTWMKEPDTEGSVLSNSTNTEFTEFWDRPV